MRKLPKIVTVRIPLYIKAEEIVPGIVLHPDITTFGTLEPEPYCCWTLTHKPSGESLVSDIFERRNAVKAARMLNRIQSADAEQSWLVLNKDWCVLVSWLRNNVRLTAAIPWAEAPVGKASK